MSEFIEDCKYAVDKYDVVNLIEQERDHTVVVPEDFVSAQSIIDLIEGLPAVHPVPTRSDHMKVGELKEILSEYPDDARIDFYLWGGSDCPSGRVAIGDEPIFDDVF